MNELRETAASLTWILVPEIAILTVIALAMYLLGREIGWRRFETIMLFVLFGSLLMAVIVSISINGPSNEWVAAFALNAVLAAASYLLARKFDSDDYVQGVSQRRRAAKALSR